jgi:hypothetical protein
MTIMLFFSFIFLFNVNMCSKMSLENSSLLEKSQLEIDLINQIEMKKKIIHNLLNENQQIQQSIIEAKKVKPNNTDKKDDNQISVMGDVIKSLQSENTNLRKSTDKLLKDLNPLFKTILETEQQTLENLSSFKESFYQLDEKLKLILSNKKRKQKSSQENSGDMINNNKTMRFKEKQKISKTDYKKYTSIDEFLDP